MTAVNPALYQAPWPEDLRPTFSRKVAKIAFNLFSCLFFPIGVIRILNHWVVRPMAIRYLILPLTLYVDGTLKALHPSEDKQESRIRRVAFDIFSLVVFPVGLTRLLNHFILRPLEIRLAPHMLYLNHGEKTTFKAASGEKIQFYYEAQKGSDKLILSVGGNCEPAQNRALDMQGLVGNTPISILTINPIGADGSSGFPGCNGLSVEESTAIAVYSAYEYAIHQLQFKKENILLYGFSWGGVGTVLGARYIQKKYGEDAVKIVNDRSLSSTSAIASAQVQNLLKLKVSHLPKNPSSLNITTHLFERAIKGVLRIGVKVVVGSAVRVAGLHLDPARVWNSLTTKNKCVIYSETDEVIPFKQASLHQPNGHPPTYQTVVCKGGHCTPLSYKAKAKVLNHIITFLGMTPQPST